MKILAIDYGDARIGLAYSDELGMLAHPLGLLKSEGMRKDIDALAAKAKEIGAESIVLGLPVNMDGSEGERALKSRRIAEILANVSGLNVELVDERLTTVSAHRTLDELEVKWEERKNIVDVMSARLILQSYLDKKKYKENV